MRIETPETSPSSSFSFQPRKPARRRPNAADAATLPPIAPLVLVAATYDESTLILTLTFDRPVSIAAFNGAAVQVGDPTFNQTLYNGSNGAYLAGPAVVGVSLAQQDDYFGTEVDLMADGTSGIVAADDGAAWAGTGGGNVPLPYP